MAGIYSDCSTRDMIAPRRLRRRKFSVITRITSSAPPPPIQKTALFTCCRFLIFHPFFQKGSADPICPYVRTSMLAISNNCVKLTTGRSHLRSANACLLSVPRTLTTYGDRSFAAVSGPVAWNSLPVALRSSDVTEETFKRQLKTFLFNCLDN